jgi:hypothetical protein
MILKINICTVAKKALYLHKINGKEMKRPSQESLFRSQILTNVASYFQKKKLWILEQK